MSNCLLIIDSRIPDLNIFTSSVNSTTSYIILDALNDTFNSLTTKIANLNINSFSYVGLIREEYFGPNYTLVDNQISPSVLENIQNLDPYLDSWSEIIDFYANLKNTYGIIELDWISCNLGNYPDYVHIFASLSYALNIAVGSANNEIGNKKYGGLWSIQTVNTVNVQDKYFSNSILNYSVSL